MNTIESFYINNWNTLTNYAENDIKTNITAFSKFLSGLILLLPAMAVYGIAYLYGRVTLPEPRNEQQIRVNDVALPQMQFHPLKKDVLHPYTGDLTADEKGEFQTHFNGEMEFAIEYGDHPCKIFIRRQDLFLSLAEVIINAANIPLIVGGGIDEHIHRLGGDAYAEQHNRLRQSYAGQFRSGYAAMVESGNLKQTHQIDKVIVVAGPSGDTSDEKESALYSCTYNALLLASEQNMTTIAFPAVSIGLFRFPRGRAANIVTKAFYDFLKSHPDTSLRRISWHFRENERFLGDYADLFQ